MHETSPVKPTYCLSLIKCIYQYIYICIHIYTYIYIYIYIYILLTFVLIVHKFYKISHSFLNVWYSVMLEGSDAINISFTIIKLFSFKKFLMQTSITGALPLFNRFHQTLLTLFVISHLIAYLTEWLKQKSKSGSS